MENKKQRTLLVLIGVFLFIFVVSVAYAALSGTLTIRGSYTFNEHLQVEFTSASFTDSARIGETAPSIIANGQTLTFAVLLNEPGDSRTIQFKITNTGNIDIATGVTLPSSGFYNMVIEWDTDPQYEDLIGTTSNVIFATIDYDPAE